MHTPIPVAALACSFWLTRSGEDTHPCPLSPQLPLFWQVVTVTVPWCAQRAGERDRGALTRCCWGNGGSFARFVVLLLLGRG